MLSDGFFSALCNLASLAVLMVALAPYIATQIRIAYDALARDTTCPKCGADLVIRGKK